MVIQTNKQELYARQEEGTACLNFDPQRLWDNFQFLQQHGIVRKDGDPNLPVLCAGCRNGYELKMFDDAGYNNVHGFDWSRKMVAVAMLTTKYDIRWDDVCNIRTFPDYSYGIVYCSHVIEHVLDPKRAIVELTDKLMSDGELVIIVPHEPEPMSKYHITAFRSKADLVEVMDVAGTKLVTVEYDSKWNEYLAIATRA